MPHSSSSSPKRRAYARMAASTASTCLRSDGDSVHSQKRDQASGRESACDMAVTLAQPQGRTGVPPSAPLPPLMEKFVIEGGVPLSGTVVPAGNKNAALPLLAACLLTDEEVVLHNVPHIRDTEAHARPARGPRRLGRARRGQHGHAVRGGRPQDRGRPDARRAHPGVLPRRRPAARALRRGAAAAAGRRRDRPPAARPAPRRLPRPRRHGRARPRHPPHRAGRRAAGVRLLHGRAVRHGHGERAHGGRADARAPP